MQRLRPIPASLVSLMAVLVTSVLAASAAGAEPSNSVGDRMAAGYRLGDATVFSPFVRGRLADESYDDPAGDATGGAPDITAVQVTDDAAGLITFSVAVGPLPAPETVVLLWLDTEGFAFRSEEFLFALAGDDLTTEQARVDGSLLRAWSPPSLSQSYENGVWQVRINQADLNASLIFLFSIVSGKLSGEELVGRDDAPDGDELYVYRLPAPPPLPNPPPPKPPLKLTSGKPRAASTPVAGRRFTMVMPVRRNDGKPAVGRVRCRGKAGTKRVSGKGLLRGGVGRCTMRIPAGTKGMKLRGTVTAQVKKAKTTGRFVFKIR